MSGFGFHTLALLAAGCKDSPKPAAAPGGAPQGAPSGQAVSVETIAAEAKGFDVLLDAMERLDVEMAKAELED